MGQEDEVARLLAAIEAGMPPLRVATTGKPSLIVDNLYGGSGKFLTQIHRIMGAGKPVDWVSSSNDQDIVASAERGCIFCSST